MFQECVPYKNLNLLVGQLLKEKLHERNFLVNLKIGLWKKSWTSTVTKYTPSYFRNLLKEWSISAPSNIEPCGRWADSWTHLSGFDDRHVSFPQLGGKLSRGWAASGSATYDDQPVTGNQKILLFNIFLFGRALLLWFDHPRQKPL